MILGDFNSNVTLVWEGGGVVAPVDIWVSHIVLALPEDVQKKVMDAVIAEVKRRNATLGETDENIAGSN